MPIHEETWKTKEEQKTFAFCWKSTGVNIDCMFECFITVERPHTEYNMQTPITARTGAGTGAPGVETERPDS